MSATNVFQTLEQRIVQYVKDKFKLGSMNVQNIQDICKFELEFLENILDTIGAMNPREMNLLRDKYLNTNRTIPDKFDTKKIILELKQELHGKAGLYERTQAFGAAIETASKYKKIVKEINANVNLLVTEGKMTIEKSRISDVVMLGILRECDLFIKYTTYLWEYFLIVLDNDKSQVPYRAQFLLDNQNQYMMILENVCDKASNYSFLKEIDYLKRSNADLTLYANGTSFLSFLDRSKYNADTELHLQHGILGFNIFAWIASKWEDWKYAKNQTARKHREWLKQEEFRFRQLLNEQDPDSPEAKRTKKYIEAYSSEITKLDQQIAEYEAS